MDDIQYPKTYSNFTDDPAIPHVLLVRLISVICAFQKFSNCVPNGSENGVN